jgi:hypothetical protein
VTTLIAGSALFGVASSAGGLTPPTGIVDKVQICHATNSDNNPYVIETPDANGDVSGHAGHTGPIWNATLKDQHISWGDIIPPFDFDGGHFPGLNWDAYGQATFANDCTPTQPAAPTTPTTTVSPGLPPLAQVAADASARPPGFTG